MAAPVWVLSVDLQTKTATFQSGMAEAAKSARGAFTEIKSGSGEMGRDVGYSMGEARHGVMMLGEEFGVHLPRGLTTFIANLGPVGAAMEAAFPFLAIILGATLLLEHLSKMHEAGEKLTSDQMKFGTAAQNAFNALDDKLLQAGIRADDLNNNHLGALAKQLILIDHQSMAELSNTFGVLAKAADAAFSDLKTSWHSFDAGSDGAKQSVESFTNEYQRLLSLHDDKGAAALLDRKIERETRLMNLQKQARDAQTGGGNGSMSQEEAQQKFAEATTELAKVKVGLGDKEVESQRTIVQLLNDQKAAAAIIVATKNVDGDNAKLSTAKEGGAEHAAAAKAAIDSQLRLSQLAIQSDQSTADAQLTIQRGSADAREAVAVSFADRELAVQLSANQKQIAALNTLASDYPNALKALQEKAQELTAQHAEKITEISNRADTERAAQQLQDLQQSERNKIEETQKSSAARLSAIGAALREEEALGLQDTSFYRDLLNQRVETARQESEEENKIRAEAGRIMAEGDQKMAELSLAAQKEKQQTADALNHVSEAVRLQHETDAVKAELELQKKGIAEELAALNKGGQDYINKKQELLEKENSLYKRLRMKSTLSGTRHKREQTTKSLRRRNTSTMK